MDVYFIRHAEINANVRIDGDDNISSYGRKQLPKLALACRDLDFEVIFTSAMQRSKITAEYANKGHNAKIIECPELNEIYRVLIGGPKKTGSEAGRARKDKRNIESFYSKMLWMASKKQYKSIAIVGHGNAFRYIIGKALKIPEKMRNQLVVSNCSITHMQIERGKAFLVSFNQSPARDRSKDNYMKIYSE